MIDMVTWAKGNWFLFFYLILIVGAFVLLRSKPSNVDSLEELSGVLTTGQPTVIEFYSNF